MAGNANSGGQNAKTQSQRVLAGSYRDDRHGGHASMKHVAGRPDTPKDLAGDALAEWERMIERLELSGSLSKVDDAAVYQYCKLYAETLAVERSMASDRKLLDRLIGLSNKLDGVDLVEAMRQIASMERIFAGHVCTVRQGRMAIRQYLVEFGMTSSARGRVKMPGGADKPAGKLMSFRGGKSTA